MEAAKPLPSDLRTALPRTRLREYWYPAMRSRKLGAKPVQVKMLGQDIMLVRRNGTIHAFSNRCPHRGLPLSMGRQNFPGTVSCADHGWTFDMQGECVAALNEGRASLLPGKVKLRTCHAEQRCGLVWVFIGDGEPRPPDVDLPPEPAFKTNIINFHIEEWDSCWLPATENLMDSHDVIVHRRSPFYFFRRLPAWVKVGAEVDEKGDAINLKYTKIGPIRDDYPGVGKWPRRIWWRRFNVSAPVPGEYPTAQMRLPGVIRVGFSSLMFVRWMVPISGDRVRAFLFSTRHAPGLQSITYRLYYHLWASWSLLNLFIGQDRVVFKHQDYSSPETLSLTDIGMVKWRRLILAAAAKREAMILARQPQSAATTEHRLQPGIAADDEWAEELRMVS